MKETETKPKFWIDKAPGKEFVHAFLSSRKWADFEQFFWTRMEACDGYPLVHDYLVTYGAFSDLYDLLTYQDRLDLLPHATKFATEVSDRFFHGALFLLGDLIPDDRINPRPETFSYHFLLLKLRAEKLSFLPNLGCAWETLARKQRHLKADEDPLEQYSAKNLARLGSRHSELETPLLNYTKKVWDECRVNFADLRHALQAIGAPSGSRQLRFVTRIESTRYWVWSLPGKPNTAHLCRLAFLRQPALGSLEIGYWDYYRQFPDRPTDKDISKNLLKIEFYPTKLETIQESQKES